MGQSVHELGAVLETDPGLHRDPVHIGLRRHVREIQFLGSQPNRLRAPGVPCVEPFELIAVHTTPFRTELLATLKNSEHIFEYYRSPVCSHPGRRGSE